MIFNINFSMALLQEPYGIFLLCVWVAIFLQALICANVLGAYWRKTKEFSKPQTLILVLLSLILNADLARLLELALHTGLFSLRSGITHFLVAFLLSCLVHLMRIKK